MATIKKFLDDTGLSYFISKIKRMPDNKTIEYDESVGFRVKENGITSNHIADGSIDQNKLSKDLSGSFVSPMDRCQKLKYIGAVDVSDISSSDKGGVLCLFKEDFTIALFQSYTGCDVKKISNDLVMSTPSPYQQVYCGEGQPSSIYEDSSSSKLAFKSSDNNKLCEYSVNSSGIQSFKILSESYLTYPFISYTGQNSIITLYADTYDLHIIKVVDGVLSEEVVKFTYDVADGGFKPRGIVKINDSDFILIADARRILKLSNSKLSFLYELDSIISVNEQDSRVFIDNESKCIRLFSNIPTSSGTVVENSFVNAVDIYESGAVSTLSTSCARLSPNSSNNHRFGEQKNLASIYNKDCTLLFNADSGTISMVKEGSGGSVLRFNPDISNKAMLLDSPSNELCVYEF